MKFLFDCKDEICLPKAYELVEEIKPFMEKMKSVEVDEKEAKADKKTMLKNILKNMMVKYPKETGELLGKLWILEDGEEKPNTFKTLATFFSNEVAVDFFTSVMPSLLQISSVVSPLLK